MDEKESVMANVVFSPVRKTKFNPFDNKQSFGRGPKKVQASQFTVRSMR